MTVLAKIIICILSGIFIVAIGFGLIFIQAIKEEGDENGI
jgi:Tfp pilus assembly protein PilO